MLGPGAAASRRRASACARVMMYAAIVSKSSAPPRNEPGEPGAPGSGPRVKRAASRGVVTARCARAARRGQRCASCRARPGSRRAGDVCRVAPAGRVPCPRAVRRRAWRRLLRLRARARRSGAAGRWRNALPYASRLRSVARSGAIADPRPAPSEAGGTGRGGDGYGVPQVMRHGLRAAYLSAECSQSLRGFHAGRKSVMSLPGAYQAEPPGSPRE